MAAMVFGNEPAEMLKWVICNGYMDWKKIPPKAALFCLDKNPFFFLPPPPLSIFALVSFLQKYLLFLNMKAFLVHKDFLPLFLNARINLLKAALPRVQVGMQCQICTSWLPPVHDSWQAAGLGGHHT